MLRRADCGEAMYPSSSIGRKSVMALTGVLLLGFVVAHLLGNLQIFLGQDAFNEYAAFLRTIPVALWSARIGLIVVFLLHIGTAFQLKKENLAARPVPYQCQNTVQASLASRTMVETGIVVFVFVVFHLLHLTFGVLKPEFTYLIDHAGRHDVYSMVIHGFQDPLYAIGYIIAVSILGIHLSHGIASFFQTLGLYHTRYTPWIRCGGKAIAFGIALGYLAIPVSVLFQCVTIPGAGS